MNQLRFIEDNLYFLKKDYGVCIVYRKKTVGPMNPKTGQLSIGLTDYSIIGIMLPAKMYKTMASFAHSLKERNRPQNEILLNARQLIIMKQDLPVEPDYEDMVLFNNIPYSVSEILVMDDNSGFLLSLIAAKGEKA